MIQGAPLAECHRHAAKGPRTSSQGAEGSAGRPPRRGTVFPTSPADPAVRDARGTTALAKRSGDRRQASWSNPSDDDIIVAHCAQVWCIDSLFSIADRLPCPVVLLSHGLSAYGSPAYAE